MSTNRYQKVIEINGASKISLPIVKFPPFKLRAAMVEKDPVIWLHLIETYNRYFAYLMSEGNLEQIDDSTYENLCLFVRSYLKELSDEEGKLLSLGMNANVSEQLQILRSWILLLIKSCGLLHLQISCDSLWDFVKLYAKDNPKTVRSLIDGSLKPTINAQKAQINRVYQLHQHLKQIVEGGKFTRVDLKALESLLSTPGKHNRSFADQFLTVKWVEILESWFIKDAQPLRDLTKNLAILSYVTASENRVVELASELHVANLESLQLYPLFASLLFNEQFLIHFNGLKAKLPFIRPVVHQDSDSGELPVVDAVDANSVQTILEVFPHLTISQVENRLKAYDGNTERTIDSFFQANDQVDEVSLTERHDHPSNPESKPFKNQLQKVDKLTAADADSSTEHVPDEVRNKTLTRALALLYQADEDEKDDTYDEAEVQRDATEELGVKEKPDHGEKLYEKIESQLWELLKLNKQLFDRSSRNTKARKDLKASTSWSDEQIEGWARMLERSPRRAQLLEEKYMFKGNQRSGKRAFVQNKQTSSSGQSKEEAKSNNGERITPITSKQPASSVGKKRQNARKEKNKSAKGNHNRKSGHDKKMSRAAP